MLLRTGGNGRPGPEELDPCVADFERLERDLPLLAKQYASAVPFPHIVFDDVLVEDVFAAASHDFPPVDETFWTNYLHVNSRKHGNTRPDTWPDSLRSIATFLTSERFVCWLTSLTGHIDLIADWTMDGGGLHQSLPGGFLNIHTDFTSHHVHHDWRRCVNVLLYLNDSWNEAWGGDLELWSADMRRCEQRIAPKGNRMVIFTTNGNSLHGHPQPLRCPDGVSRQSMALYYFQIDPTLAYRSTSYRARPEDGAFNSVKIYLDTKVLRGYDIVKRRIGLPDDAASQVLRRLTAVSQWVRRGRRSGGAAGNS